MDCGVVITIQICPCLKNIGKGSKLGSNVDGIVVAYPFKTIMVGVGDVATVGSGGRQIDTVTIANIQFLRSGDFQRRSHGQIQHVNTVAVATACPQTVVVHTCLRERPSSPQIWGVGGAVDNLVFLQKVCGFYLPDGACGALTTQIVCYCKVNICGSIVRPL